MASASWGRTWRLISLNKGYTIAVCNRAWTTTEKFIADAGLLASRIIACCTMADLATNIRAPRPVIIMVKAGDAVDEQIASFCEVLEANDIIIDAGNANYHDTVRRDTELARWFVLMKPASNSSRKPACQS